METHTWVVVLRLPPWEEVVERPWHQRRVGLVVAWHHKMVVVPWAWMVVEPNRQVGVAWTVAAWMVAAWMELHRQVVPWNRKVLTWMVAAWMEMELHRRKVVVVVERHCRPAVLLVPWAPQTFVWQLGDVPRNENEQCL